jgi:hypothetical protein
MWKTQIMKRVLLIATLVLGIGVFANAQRVRARLDFPVNVTIGAPGPAPYSGAIWIGPEWRWERNQYVVVPGYWARPAPHRRGWVNGHWERGRRGYMWRPGRWN